MSQLLIGLLWIVVSVTAWLFGVDPALCMLAVVAAQPWLVSLVGSGALRVEKTVTTTRSVNGHEVERVVRQVAS